MKVTESVALTPNSRLPRNRVTANAAITPIATPENASVIACLQSDRPVIVSAPLSRNEFLHHAGLTALIERGALSFVPACLRFVTPGSDWAPRLIYLPIKPSPARWKFWPEFLRSFTVILRIDFSPHY